jgi:hypothetical protein
MSIIRFNKELLQEIIERDEAKLIGEYEKFNREIMINFKCKCGKEDIKKFRPAFSYGLTCKICTFEKGQEKIKKTIVNNYGGSHFNKKNIVKVEEEIDKKEHELRKWRDDLLKTIDLTKISKDEWFNHPIQKDYKSKSDGSVMSLKKNKLVGSENSLGGYSRIPCKPSIFRHRFLLECIYSTLIPIEYDVDHIDANPRNNTLENLQIVTRKEHAQKTADTNPHSARLAGIVNSKAVECSFKNSEGSIEICKFLSIKEAMEKYKISNNPIIESIKKTKPDIYGRTWKYSDITEEDFGEWRDVPDLLGCKASSEGYIKNENGNLKQRTGSECKNSGYLNIKVNGKTCKVHQLICKAFHGEAPSKEHTVDHIDGNRKNNKATNLRWATKEEQSKNRSNIRPIEVYNTNNFQVMETFETKTEFIEKYDISWNTCLGILNLNLDGNSMSTQISPELSIRFSDLSLDEKKERELKILEHKIYILNLGSKSKKSLDLLSGITKRENGKYRLVLSFLGQKIDKTLSNLEEINKFRNEWIQSQIENRRSKIMEMI